MRLDLLFPEDRYVQHLMEVTSTVAVTNKQIDEDGLYSLRIFGPIGTQERMERIGYINLNCELIHPTLFSTLTSHDSLIRDILDNKVKVIFEKGYFTLSEKGESGYSFISKHVKDINLGSSTSNEKQNRIDQYNKYVKQGKTHVKHALVISAGIRDIELDDDRVTEDELNEFYKSVMNASSVLKFQTSNNDSFLLNLQRKVALLVEAIYIRIKGKKGFIGKHVSTRTLEYGTANVISGNMKIIENLREQEGRTPVASTATTGLYQFLKMTQPKAIHYILNDIGDNFIDHIEKTAFVYDGLKIKNVILSDKSLDQFSTVDGANGLINKMKDYHVRDYPVTIKDNKGKEHNVLMCKDTGKTIEACIGIDVDKDYRPMTYGEMFIYIINKYYHDSAQTGTRYPIASNGSLVGFHTNVYSTMKEREVEFTIRDQHNETTMKIVNYPITGEDWNESYNVPASTFSGFGADNDGDSLSANAALSEEAIKEIKDLISSTKYYFSPNGDPLKDDSDKISESVMAFMTMRKKG